MNDAQMLKGLLDGCILELISDEASYGYKITEVLNMSGFEALNEGTVYPVLIRLEKKGYVASLTRKSPLGPKRKYFRITEEGEVYLRQFKESWNSISKAVNMIVGGDEEDEL